jgi:hypothetical protein
VILSQVPCTPYHPPNIAGVIQVDPEIYEAHKTVARSVYTASDYLLGSPLVTSAYLGLQLIPTSALLYIFEF